jgi:catechol 2,3-dioxygenase-like lactoylglutathione lyase family enzyme
MTLNHLNLTVTDVRAAAAFLETYFGMRPMGGNAGMAFVTDDRGFVLSIMKGGKSATVDYPETFHIGFFVDSEETVNDIYNRLSAEGFDVTEPQRHHGYGFYVKAPGGFTVELGA